MGWNHHLILVHQTQPIKGVAFACVGWKSTTSSPAWWFNGDESHERQIQDAEDGCFLKWWSPTTMGFPTKNDHFGVFWGHPYFWKHPHVKQEEAGGFASWGFSPLKFSRQETQNSHGRRERPLPGPKMNILKTSRVHLEDHPRTCKWLGSPLFISHEKNMWKGNNPILRGLTNHGC